MARGGAQLRSFFIIKSPLPPCPGLFGVYKPLTPSTLQPVNLKTGGTVVPEAGEGNSEPFPPHPSRFTSRKAASRIFGRARFAIFARNKRVRLRFHPLLAQAHAARMRKSAFTLAEVLITLGIIGIVAAMTLPALIQKKTNSEVEAKLKKIYSTMNQAIMLSEIDNGPKEYWPNGCNDTTCEEYFNKYILKYLKDVTHKSFKSYGGYNIAIYFSDGTVLVGKAGYDYYFFPNAKNFDEENFAIETADGGVNRNGCGTTYFAFSFRPSYKDDKFHYKKGFEPYRHSLVANTKEALTDGPYGCSKLGTAKVFCTAWIQLNGWKIPDDYPFQVK